MKVAIVLSLASSIFAVAWGFIQNPEKMAYAGLIVLFIIGIVVEVFIIKSIINDLRPKPKINLNALPPEKIMRIRIDK